MKKRGVFPSFAKLNFLFPKSFEVVMARELDRRTERGRTLDEDFSSHVASPGAPGDLRQQLKRPLSSAKIWHVQADIRVDNANQRDVRKIKTLGNHLRPDQNVDFASSKRLQRLSIGVFPRHRIGVHSRDCCGWKEFAHRALDLLGSIPGVANRDVTAFRAFSRRQSRMSAEMAFQPVFTLMKGERDTAIRTVADKTALIADQRSGESSPVE